MSRSRSHVSRWNSREAESGRWPLADPEPSRTSHSRSPSSSTPANQVVPSPPMVTFVTGGRYRVCWQNSRTASANRRLSTTTGISSANVPVLEWVAQGRRSIVRHASRDSDPERQRKHRKRIAYPAEGVELHHGHRCEGPPWPSRPGGDEDGRRGEIGLDDQWLEPHRAMHIRQVRVVGYRPRLAGRDVEEGEARRPVSPTHIVRGAHQPIPPGITISPGPAPGPPRLRKNSPSRVKTRVLPSWGRRTFRRSSSTSTPPTAEKSSSG